MNPAQPPPQQPQLPINPTATAPHISDTGPNGIKSKSLSLSAPDVELLRNRLYADVAKIVDLGFEVSICEKHVLRALGNFGTSDGT